MTVSEEFEKNEEPFLSLCGGGGDVGSSCSQIPQLPSGK